MMMALRSIHQSPKGRALVLWRKNQILSYIRISPLPGMETKRFNRFLRNQMLAAYKANHSSPGVCNLQTLRLDLSPL